MFKEGLPVTLKFGENERNNKRYKTSDTDANYTLNRNHPVMFLILLYQHNYQRSQSSSQCIVEFQCDTNKNRKGNATAYHHDTGKWDKKQNKTYRRTKQIRLNSVVS